MSKPLNKPGYIRLWLIRLFILGMLACICGYSATLASAQEIPAGFRLIAEQAGVALYRKDYPGGTPDYVQVIDLSLGASLDLLHGQQVAMNSAHNRGMFGGPNPSFRQQSIRTFWDQYASSQVEAFCVTNGQFFYMPESPTPLALPLLVDHQLLAEGFGYPQYPEKQLFLAIWWDHADILPLTSENLYATDAESIIGGLTEEANKKPKNAVGRTFVGIWDKDGDQRFETIAVYTTRTATQPEAARTIRSFGAAKVMMLDGGGSTQLICQGETYIDTTRAIPQALGVSAGSQEVPPPKQSPVVQDPVQSELDLNPIPMENADAEKLSLPENIPDTFSPPMEVTSTSAQQDPQNAGQTGAEQGIQLSTSASLTVPESTMESAQNAVILAPVQITTPVTQPTAVANQNLGALTVARANENGLSTSIGSVRFSSASTLSTQNVHANGLDVLLLPVIISPLSVILFYVGRRQISLLYRE